MKNLLVVLFAAVLCACQSSTHTSGTHKRKTAAKFKGLSRTYLLHTPRVSEHKKYPLVVVLHGAFSTAGQMEQQSGFSKVADEKEFYVAYPNGIGLFGKLQHWNAGHCCGKAVRDDVDDVGFIAMVMQDAMEHFPIDPERIYLVGYSNGGMMAYRFAEEQTGKLAALAVVSGAINSWEEGKPRTWEPEIPSAPLPVLIMHGNADPIIPVNGGESPARKNGRLYASTQDAMDFWKTNNQQPEAVELILLDNWGHDWPGPFFSNRAETPQHMKKYNAAEIIWDCLSDY
ncbi:PHB depolymerase family esterase [Pontiellaceae bacterium B12227]|nr:PHB depolymerase family esterase [Pontiellaceae bacterium B12227]